MNRRGNIGRAGVILAAVALSSCGTMEDVALSFRDLTPHEAYFESLKAAGLEDTALSEAWLLAAQSAFERAPEVSLPFQEEGYLFPDAPEARSYRVQMRRGQFLSVTLSLAQLADQDTPTRVFVDVYLLREGREAVPVASTDETGVELTYTAARDADYVVRIQPELLRGGQYHVTLRAEASMSFPVEGQNTGAIQSRFGVDRDGGRRSHHGVDIFARRNTPVLSATDGTVSRVEVTNLGGKVVWIRDSNQRQSVYYAHLDSQLVRQGARVRKGDPVGLVGNTGNARTTPPHLHFGIYRRGEGPVDPYYFLYQTDARLRDLTAPLDALGAWARTTQPDIRLRVAPTRQASVVEALPQHTPLRVLAGTGEWYRVRLPDGRSGYVAARLTESIEVPVRTEVLSESLSLQAHPTVTGSWVRDLERGSALAVLGRFGDFLFVRADNGRPGWTAVASAETDR